MVDFAVSNHRSFLQPTVPRLPLGHTAECPDSTEQSPSYHSGVIGVIAVIRGPAVDTCANCGILTWHHTTYMFISSFVFQNVKYHRHLKVDPPEL